MADRLPDGWATGMFQVCSTGISVLGYFSHGNYCPSLCFCERKYIGVIANPEIVSSEWSLFTHETKTVLCKYLPVRLGVNLQVFFFFLVSVILCIYYACVQCSRCEFQWRNAGAVIARPSRWCEVVHALLHCCLLSHHCGTDQWEGRGQLPAYCLGTTSGRHSCFPSYSSLFTFSFALGESLVVLYWRNFFFGNTKSPFKSESVTCHSNGPHESLNIGKMKQ